MEREPDAAGSGNAPFDAVVVGAGLTGLTLGHLLARRRPSWRIAVLEGRTRAGGTAGSETHDGFTTDLGPNGFLGGAPHTEALLDALGLAPQPAAPAARRRYLYRDGGLRPLPDGPGAFLTSELLGPVGKARALLEPWLGRTRAVGADESLHAFLARRFGRAAADVAAEPLVLGTTAGDPRELSAAAAFPRLVEMERAHGSLLRAMVRGRRAETRGSGRTPERARADRRLRAFGGRGMQALVDALSADLGERLRTGAVATALQRDGEAWRVGVGDQALRTRRLALATPAHAAAPLLEPLDPGLAAPLRAIPYVDVRVLGLGFRRVDVPHPLDGFGYLVPAGQGARSLGVLWSSSLFPGQAPEDTVHLRVIAGGRRDPELATMAPSDALEAVRRDLWRTLGVTAPPLSVHDVQWPLGLPQYTLGHAARVADVRGGEARWPGLGLVGTAYGGVGVNDAIRDAYRLADAWAPS